MGVMKFGRWAGWWLTLGAALLALCCYCGRLVMKETPVPPTDRTDFSTVLSGWKRATLDAFPRDPSPRRMAFPSDHGAHVRTPAEYWNVLIRLASAERDLALNVSIARLGSAPEPPKRGSRWAANQFFRSFVSVTDSYSAHYRSYEQYARGALGLSGFGSDPPRLWVAGNSLEWSGGAAPGDRAVLILREPEFAAEVRLSPVKASQPLSPTMQAKGGWKGYIVPRYAAEGVVVVRNRTWTASGGAWLSHTWGGLPPAGGQVVFSRWTLVLDDGSELALLQMQRRDGSGEASLQGIRIAPDGSIEELDSAALDLRPLVFEGAEPVDWRLRLPGRSLDLRLYPWTLGHRGSAISNRRTRAIRVERTDAGGQRVGWGFLDSDGF